MSYFEFKNSKLFAENLCVADLAEKYGTPLYVYSKNALEDVYRQYDQSLEIPHQVCYAVKANSNIAVLQTMARLGAGFDIVSRGELARVLKAGGDASKVVYSGVAKSVEEIEFALKSGICSFNVESEAEMERISHVASQLHLTAPVSIRINPDVDAHTHPYISTGLKKNKFGVPIERAFNLYLQARNLPGIEIKGIDCHIGSQLTELKPFADALDRVLILVDRLKKEGITLEHIDMGGGLGVVYDNETPPSPQEYMQMLQDRLKDTGLKLLVEPGRSMVANAGILVAKVEYLKEGEASNFAIVDTGMNDMIRPSLYSAWMKISNAVEKDCEEKVYDVVGPVCESGDFLGKERSLRVAPGDYLVQFSAGAYGFSMASSYNSRPRAAEVMVDCCKEHLIRRRETVEELWQQEILLAE